MSEKLPSDRNLGIALLLMVLLVPAVQAVRPAGPDIAGGRAIPGAARMELLLPMVRDSHLALVVNHTSLVEGRHLVDTLLGSGISRENIRAVFSPEHGFRGDRAAGSTIGDQVDPVTGITLFSLYGSRKKPDPEQLAGTELVVFDLQDVGVRFYTYISTLHYVMEACAENGIPLLVLDRPNPNGNYVDGPVLEPEFRSFIGMHPIPVVYGLTIGELAGMINGEGWLRGGIQCDLEVLPCTGYRRSASHSLPVAPSPNLPNDHAIRLYPSTCFFEGTVMSEGRGTPMPFEVFGHPDFPGDFSFTPERIPGVAEHPKFEGLDCRGMDLRDFVPPEGWTQIRLEWLMEAYAAMSLKEEFFTPHFDKLAGTAALRQQIMEGRTGREIREHWAPGLRDYLNKRKRYLLYP